MFASTLSDFHTGFSWVVIIGNAMAGIWALSAHKVVALRSRALWWFTTLAQFTMFVQVAIGVVLVNKEKLVLQQFHAFYGFVGIIAIAIIYSYRSQLNSRPSFSAARRRVVQVCPTSRARIPRPMMNRPPKPYNK